MESRDVTVADNPFRIVAQRQAVKTVEKMHSSIATPRADDGTCVRIEKGCLQIGIALVVSAA